MIIPCSLAKRNSRRPAWNTFKKRRKAQGVRRREKL
jgi:hypothetical protein